MKINKEIISNKELVEQLMKKTGVRNQVGLARYLSKKYECHVSTQNINSFINNNSSNVGKLIMLGLFTK